MRRAITHAFVEQIPATLKEGVVYVSIPFATAVHKCACGCGNEVVTPITPTDWQLTFDGDTITLHPSIGNWNLPCQSHYFIRRNTIQWAPRWSPAEITTGRRQEQQAKATQFTHPSLWQKIKKHFEKEH